MFTHSHLTAFCPGIPGELVPASKITLNFTGARDDGCQ